MNINLDTVKQAVKAAVDPLRARARGLVRRAVLMALDNSGGLARVQVELTADELADGVELLSWPGISIRPEGCEAIVFAIGGNPSNLIAIPSQRGKRLAGDDLEPGEVALHIGNVDQVVRLKNDGSILLQSGTDKATLELQPDGSVVASSGPTGAQVELKPNGDIVLTPAAAGKIFLGSDGATRAVAFADEVYDAFQVIQSDMQTHIHSGVMAGPGTTGVIVDLLTGVFVNGSDTIFGDT